MVCWAEPTFTILLLPIIGCSTLSRLITTGSEIKFCYNIEYRMRCGWINRRYIRYTYMQYLPKINIKGGRVHQWYMTFDQQCYKTVFSA